jgi:signal transduction histidine kinase
MTTGTVLVVDDEADLRLLLETELVNEGYTVTVAGDGAEALERLADATFDVVVSDVMMPRLDGVSLLRAVRRMAPDTEVVMATGYATLESAVECLRAGAFDLLHKPVHISDVLATVSRALERKALRAATALYEASQVLLTARDAGRLPETVIDVAMRVMHADAASLLLMEPGERLRVAERGGIATPAEDAARIALAEAVAKHRCGAPMLVSPATSTRWPELQPAGGPARSSLVHPLMVGGELIGVLELERTEGQAFRAADLERSGVLASQVVLALDNTRLMARLVAAERFATVGQVAAGVAHEIKNPLAYVITNLRYACAAHDETSATTTGSDEMRDALREASEGARAIQEIVSGMLGMARAEPGELERVVVRDAVQTAARLLGCKARTELELDIPRELVVIGWSGRLVQVFANLFGNSLQAFGGRRGSIRVEARADRDQVRIEFRDDGGGIDAALLPRIFEPFFTTKPQGQGTGLGLYITRELVRAQGGDISVESDPGRGTVFHLTFSTAAA